LPTGIWNCASSLGPTIAPPLLTVLMISFGWRWMFVSMGLLGIVVATVWYTVYREVAETALSPGEAHHLTETTSPRARRSRHRHST
jgi:MFS family permease